MTGCDEQAQAYIAATADLVAAATRAAPRKLAERLAAGMADGSAALMLTTELRKGSVRVVLRGVVGGKDCPLMTIEY